MKKYVAYYRVSTKEQGDSGLGLAAQKSAVTTFVSQNGELVGEFQDIQSGTSENRVGLDKAILECQLHGATLVVKELSRITRGGYKYLQILEKTNTEFIECGSPHDPEVVKGIKLELAKEERRKVRNRTVDALAEIKAKLERGEEHISKAGNVVTSLGSPDNLTDEAREKSIKVRRDLARNNPENIKAGAFILALADSNNFKQITEKLNEAGFKTSRGNDFSEMQTKRLYERYK